MEEKKLFLLDAYALIYRAYYALIRSPRVTSKGLNTSAIFGFCNTLDEILRKENPSHIAVCFDPPGGHTFRHDVYPEYKAQRDKQPEDITLSIPYIKEILEAFNIPVIEVEGYEADDVIGTLSRHAEREGFTTYMMTPDKDYGQLVTEKVLMYRPALRGEGFELRGPAEVCARYGIPSPKRVIDLLALEGDTSDNIPGCPGVGEKTAQKLIEEWGTVENLIEHVEELKGALKRKISENAEKIMFSKYLVTIKTDVPVDIPIESLRRKPEDAEKLLDIYRRLEFKTFIKRLEGRTPGDVTSSPSPAETNTVSNGMGSLFDIPTDESKDDTAQLPNGDYHEITAIDDIKRAIDGAIASGTVAISLYAVGEEAMTAHWKGFALSTSPGNVDYISLPAVGEERVRIIETLAPLFTSPGVMIISHDIKRDIIILRRDGIEFSSRYFDTAIAHYLLDPEKKHHLPALATCYLDIEMQSSPTDARKVYPTTEMEPTEALARYCEEADVILRLKPLLGAGIKEEGMEHLFDEIELPLARVLADMEWNGARIDPAELHTLSRQLTARLNKMEEEAYQLAGERFNLGSPMQVGEILFGKLAIGSKAKKTTRGFYSTTEQILEKHRNDHPLVGLILKIRRLRKLLATYIDTLPGLINPSTGKIHTTYNQTVTATGRISSTNPNLQNIPIRTDDGREIRRAFIADPGDLFMSADYSQIELRLMADLSADKEMVDAFLSGADIHQATAAKIYHERIKDVTETQRRNAKTANFGIIYGISAFGLSERLSIPRAEAKMLIDGYFATYPHIRDYMERSIEKARSEGFVTTIKGRKRRLPDINSRNSTVRGYAERNAINAPIQGSAADIIKIAMVNIHRHIIEAGLKSTMIMQVHDELIFNVKPDELPQLQEIVINDMKDAYHGLVPLEVACGTATNWLEAH